MPSSRYVIALDQDTVFTHCSVFDHDGNLMATTERDHRQILPAPGYVEHDPMEIWKNARLTLAEVLAVMEITSNDVAALGITNQRETAVLWDKTTGLPICNAIVWQDTRSHGCLDEVVEKVGEDRIREITGLPPTIYFAAPRIKWMLDNVEGARKLADEGKLLFGTMDTWLIWNLTGGAQGSVDGPAKHVTDVSNASRTMLMNINTCQWDDELLAAFDIPKSILPRIRSSSEVYGHVRRRGPLPGVAISGILGDQQAAAFGQACLAPGEAKISYGTGNSLLLNVGAEPAKPADGLISTVFYRLADEEPVYALEGSIAVTGLAVRWLRDNMGFFNSSDDIEALAAEVEDNGGVYFVPAFSGIMAPRWREDARGTIVGLTRFANRNHIARAALEATAYQTREVAEAMRKQADVQLKTVKVDGGMTENKLLMQFQADMLNCPVVRGELRENASLGTAYAAGLAVDFWSSTDEIRANWIPSDMWTPHMDQKTREELFHNWNKAVERSLNWA